MAFRPNANPSPSSQPYPPPYSNPAQPHSTSLSGPTMPPADPSSPSLSKRQRIDSLHDAVAPIHDGAFVEDQDAAESGGDDDDDEDKPKSDKKAGRRKIKIEFIQDKSRRHITFSKRKAGIMKKAYELSTLTGTQVLLLVVSETGLVYTFTTAKLQPLVTQPEGKNLIQACLNAPHGALPSSMPVGTPIGRSGPMSMPAHHAGGPANVPGGLSIAGVPTNKDDAEQDDAEPEDAQPTTERGSRKRRRASSSAGGAASPASRANTLPTAPVQQGPPSTQQPSTSPNARPGAIPPLQGQPPALSIPSGQPLPLDPHSPRQGQAQPTSPNYTHGNPYPPQGDPNMYSAPPHQQQHGGYPPAPPYGFSHEGGPGQQNAGLAAAHPGPWGPPPQVQQGSHYGRR